MDKPLSMLISFLITEGSLEALLPTIYGHWQQQGTESKASGFPKFYGPALSKTRLPQAAGAEPSGQMRDEQLHVTVARSTWQNTPLEHFWNNSDVENLYAVVALSACDSKSVEDTSVLKHAVLEAERLKKRTALWREAHLEVKVRKAPQLRSSSMKKWTAVWREAHFEVKTGKARSCSEHY